MCIRDSVTSLRFEGPGVRLDGLEVKKAGSTITGAAYVAWAGTYSFNADGRRLAVDALDLTYFPTLPALTGFADFSATGSGTFDEPRYDVKVSVSDLFIGEEGIGEMTATVGLRGLKQDKPDGVIVITGISRAKLGECLERAATSASAALTLSLIHI